MKIISFVLLLFGFITSVAQSGLHSPVATEQLSGGAGKNMLLQLMISPESEKYCAGDVELDALRMKLKLRYTNLGKEPLILYKGSNLISRLMISRSPEDATAGRFEVNASLTHVTDEGGAKIDTPTPGPLFIILPAGASYETGASLSVFAVRDDANRIEGAVSSGEHVLRIEVLTWPASKDLANELQDRWQRSGCLWYESVKSMPMRFNVEKVRKLADCP